MELSCPQCGLVLAMTRPQIEYCPRCIARRRQPVPLVARALQRLGGERGPASAGADDAMPGRDTT